MTICLCHGGMCELSIRCSWSPDFGWLSYDHSACVTGGCTVSEVSVAPPPPPRTLLHPLDALPPPPPHTGPLRTPSLMLWGSRSRTARNCPPLECSILQNRRTRPRAFRLFARPSLLFRNKVLCSPPPPFLFGPIVSPVWPAGAPLSPRRASCSAGPTRCAVRRGWSCSACWHHANPPPPTTVEVGILRRVGPRHLPTRRTSPTRRSPTPCTTLYDASYIPDASGPDTLYDTVRRVVQCRTTLYDTVRHCTTLYDTVRHCTTQYDTVRHSTTQYDAVRHSTTQYDTVRHCTTQYDTVRHSTTQYDTVRHCTTQYDTVQHSTTQYDTVRRVVQCRTTYICIYMYVCIHCTTQYDTVRHSTTQYDTVRHCTTLYDTVRHSTTQYDTVRHSTTQYDTVRHSTTLYDTVRHSTTRRTVSYDIYMYIYVCMYIYIHTHTHTYIHCRLIVDTVGML